MSNPATGSQGILRQAYIVTASHGRALLPVVQTISLNDAFGNTLLDEMGTNAPVLNVQAYDGGTFSFDIFETDIPTVYALLMDLDPATTKMMVRPEALYQCKFTFYGNQLSSLTGNPYEGFVAEQCLIQSHDRSQDRNKNMKVTFKGNFTRATKVTGLGVLYTRGVKTPGFATADDVSFTSTTCTLSKVAYACPDPGLGGTTTAYLCAIKNKKTMPYGTSGFTLSGSTFTDTAISASDTWDILTPYAP